MRKPSHNQDAQTQHRRSVTDGSDVGFGVAPGMSDGLQPEIRKSIWAPKRKPAKPEKLPVLSEQQEASWPERPFPKRSLRPQPQTEHLGKHPNETPVVLVSVIGLTQAGVENVLGIIDRQVRSGNPISPVFLTDGSAHTIFKQAGFVFEYLPRAIFFSKDMPDRFSKRFKFIWSKWRPEYLLDLGKPGVLRRCLQNLDDYLKLRTEREDAYSPRREKTESRPRVVTDIATLRADYEVSGLHHTEDTFAFYRIIGNEDAQSREAVIQRLKLILNEEPEFEDCEKRWIINRIVDSEIEAAIISLLRDKNQPYLHLPFDWEEYRAIEISFEGFPQENFLLDGHYQEMSPRDKLAADLHVRRNKCRYLMNENGARNLALQDGRGRAKWILPWNGVSFFDSGDWSRITRPVRKSPFFKYVLVDPPSSEIRKTIAKRREPQILFRQDASEMFDETHVYGRNSTVDLFRRLGAAGPWDGWTERLWDAEYPSLSDDAGSINTLKRFDDFRSFDADWSDSERAQFDHESSKLDEASVAFVDEMDTRLLALKFDKAKLAAYDEDALATLAAAPPGSGKAKILELLQQNADLALHRGPFSVFDKDVIPPSGNKQDYFSSSPSWVPRPGSPTGMPEIKRTDGNATGDELYDLDGKLSDRLGLQRVFDDTTILALAGTASGTDRYLEHAACQVRTWFIDDATRMSPKIVFGQARPEAGSIDGQPAGLLDMMGVHYFLDAVC